MIRHLAASLVAVAALASWMTPAAAAAAGPPNITCGEIISSSITLNANVSCPGTVFRTNSSTPIVIDLGGHTVVSRDPNQFTISVGTSATIQHGRVRGRGITDAYGTGQSVYQHLVVDGGLIASLNDRFPTIRNNRFINGAGVYSDRNTVDIENNVFVNGPADKVAVALGSTYSTVLNNQITGYRVGISATDVLASVDFRSNRISHAGVGIQIGGVSFDALPGTVSGNIVTYSTGDGILLGDGSGRPASGQTPGLIASHNVTNHNGGDGIHVNPIAPQPGGDEYLDVTVRANRADSNGNLGIESPGTLPQGVGVNVTVTDGGDNRARLNGNPAQCTHVACAA